MAEKLLMIALSPTMDEGTIASWTKEEGDTIDTGDVICEVETDKATMDYESTQDGTLLKIIVPEGGSAAVGETIGIIGESGEDIEDMVKEAESEQSRKKGGEDKGGETEKEQAEQETPAGAKAEEKAPKAKKPAEGAKAPPAPEGKGGRVLSSPLARTIAEQEGVDLTALTGSGPEGRIVKKDVERAVKEGIGIGGNAAGAGTAGAEAAAAGAATAAGGAGQAVPGLEEKRVKVSRKRAVIAKRLSESKYSAPHYYLTLTIHMDNLMAARERINSERVKSGVGKISLNSFILKIAAEAIKRNHRVNSSWEGDEIVTHGTVDIGVAVAQEDGLITPVVKNCGGKGIVQIDGELRDLIGRARENKLAPEEYSGATFSISNLGNYGIEEFTAIINPPGSAILAIGTMKKEPVVDENNEIRIVKSMKVTLSCDHRVLDGAVGAEFLHQYKTMMEDPIRVIL